MIAKLDPKLAEALQASPERELEVIDPETNRTYLIVDRDVHRRAMEALRRQEDRDAIAQGLAEMEAGQGMSVEEARKLTKERLMAREP